MNLRFVSPATILLGTITRISLSNPKASTCLESLLLSVAGGEVEHLFQDTHVSTTLQLRAHTPCSSHWIYLSC
jgi:hypothetical protein